MQITGTLTPQTIALINQQSCNGSYGNTYGNATYNNGYTNGYSNSYPASSNQNCTWSGSTYVCSYLVTPPAPVYMGGYTNGYSNGYSSNYSNSYYDCGYNNNSWNYNRYQNTCAPYVGSVSASYTYSGLVLTIKGNGFSPTGNIVHIGGITVAGAASNGQTLVVSVSTSYQYGNYAVSVTNASGINSNSLSFMISGYPNNQYGNYNYEATTTTLQLKFIQ